MGGKRQRGEGWGAWGEVRWWDEREGEEQKGGGGGRVTEGGGGVTRCGREEGREEGRESRQESDDVGMVRGATGGG